ncbi:MAG: heavy-metal-associated domain-containing protein [Bacteroidales bacterium]|nr:heavy-metal-associated domain-containing protein [Bacteroidales bacterium]
MKREIRVFGIVWLVLFLLVFTSTGMAQNKKNDTIKIKTSAVCNQCKDRIETGLAYEKGVKDVSLDVETKIVTIKYNTKATTPEELRKKISNLGYDADDVPAVKAAYDKLPACCKKDAKKH